jgi:hypothetical protein
MIPWKGKVIFIKLILYSCKNNSLLLRADRGVLKVLGTTNGSLKDP